MRIFLPVQGARIKFYPEGGITQYYANKLPDANGVSYYKQFGLDGHNGLDIVAPFRTPILATKGVVCEAKTTPDGFGEHVRILTIPEPNGDYLELTYGHLDEVFVKIGDKVEDGQLIGYMGNTGSVVSSTYITNWGLAPARGGVHLHLGVRACSTEKTKWVTTYSDGKKAFIKDYENGYKGAIDPLPFIEIPPEVKFTFERNLQIGNSHPDVLKLQQFLNTHHCQVSDFGAGAPGLETTFFGNRTRQAVMKFQAINNIPSTGNCFELTRAKINSII